MAVLAVILAAAHRLNRRRKKKPTDYDRGYADGYSDREFNGVSRSTHKASPDPRPQKPHDHKSDP